MTENDTPKEAHIAVIGCGWWTQGWHLVHLCNNPSSKIVAICDSSPHPKSALNPDLESLDELSKRYSCPMYLSIDDLLADSEKLEIDGVIVCTPHATHYEIGKKIMEESPTKVHVLMEKPFTTDIKEAFELNKLANDYSLKYNKTFLVNHSANYRKQTIKAKHIVESGVLGDIRHVTGFMGSPLIWIFDDPLNKAWNEPTGSMLGNGFAWGQSSHILAWIFHVTGLHPSKVFCTMNHSEKTGADISHAASIICENGANISLSGTTLVPGNAHSSPSVGKLIRLKIFGSKGALVFSGDDQVVESGRLELRHPCGKIEDALPGAGFLFENCSHDGNGPESLQAFLNVCNGKEFYNGADGNIGLMTVQTLDAMYRSSLSLNLEDVIDCVESS